MMTELGLSVAEVARQLDIGGRPDPLGRYAGAFARMLSCRTWDLDDGDAQVLAGVPDAAFDFVHSSHCLEHLHDPAEGPANWARVVKPGGYVVVTVPDEDLYERARGRAGSTPITSGRSPSTRPPVGPRGR